MSAMDMWSTTDDDHDDDGSDESQDVETSDSDS